MLENQGKHTDAGLLRKHITRLQAAVIWAGDLGEHSIATLTETFTTLTTGPEAVITPLILELKCTVRIGTEYSGQSRISEWVASVEPIRRSEESWSPTNCCFSALALPQAFAVKMIYFQEWARAIIPDPLISMIVDATNAGLDSLDVRTQKLVAALTGVLSPLVGPDGIPVSFAVMCQSSHFTVRDAVRFCWWERASLGLNLPPSCAGLKIHQRPLDALGLKLRFSRFPF